MTYTQKQLDEIIEKFRYRKDDTSRLIFTFAASLLEAVVEGDTLFDVKIEDMSIEEAHKLFELLMEHFGKRKVRGVVK